MILTVAAACELSPRPAFFLYRLPAFVARTSPATPNTPGTLNTRHPDANKDV
jgi:hypothetical protein